MRIEMKASTQHVNPEEYVLAVLSPRRGLKRLYRSRVRPLRKALLPWETLRLL